jgi:hypothetical protein
MGHWITKDYREMWKEVPIVAVIDIMCLVILIIGITGMLGIF